MKHAKMVLGFLSTTLPQAASSLASNFSETIKDPKHWGPGAALAVFGLGSEAWLVKKLKDCKNMKLKEVVGDNLLHFLLSVAAGAFAGGAAYLSSLSDQDQAELIGLTVAALNLTIADLRVLFRARQDTRRAPESYLLLEHQYLNINEGRPESKLSHQDVLFAKSMKKNILVKLPLLYIAGVVIYEATPLIKDKTSADNYFTDHADTMALALPIGLHRIWSMVTPYVVKPAPQNLLPNTFEFGN